jgi:hypothetical protein
LSAFHKDPKFFSIDSKFVTDLINKGILKPTLCCQNDSLVIYFDEAGQVKHSGTLIDNAETIVLSKWGWDGLPLFHHLIDLVPGKAHESVLWPNNDPYFHSYGSEVRCYERPDLSMVERHFQNYYQIKCVEGMVLDLRNMH